MTLAEAIKVNTDLLSKQNGKGLSGRIDALKLSIEALKHIQQERHYGLAFYDKTLPGETRK